MSERVSHLTTIIENAGSGSVTAHGMGLPLGCSGTFRVFASPECYTRGSKGYQETKFVWKRCQSIYLSVTTDQELSQSGLCVDSCCRDKKGILLCSSSGTALTISDLPRVCAASGPLSEERSEMLSTLLHIVNRAEVWQRSYLSQVAAKATEILRDTASSSIRSSRDCIQGQDEVL